MTAPPMCEDDGNSTFENALEIFRTVAGRQHDQTTGQESGDLACLVMRGINGFDS